MNEPEGFTQELEQVADFVQQRAGGFVHELHRRLVWTAEYQLARTAGDGVKAAVDKAHYRLGEFDSVCQAQDFED